MLDLQIISLGIIIYMTLLGMTMVLVFVESRLPFRTSAMIVYTVAAVLIVVEIILSKFVGIQTLLRLYTLIVHLPSLLVFLLLSRHRGWRMVFQILSAVLFCTLIHHIATIFYYVSGQRFWTIPITYLVLSPLCIWLLYFRLRPLVLQVLIEIKHGWWFICTVIIVYYGIIIYLIPGYVGIDLSTTVLKPMFSLLISGFYCLLILFFSRCKKEIEARFHMELTALSLSALQSRIATMQATEENMRIERHDLRHRLHIISELIAQEKDQEALAFIGFAQKQLDEQKLVHWCQLPILDAVFSAYFRQANLHGIRVDAHISLPDSLEVDESELAVVFANALENAIHACLDLPKNKRKIHCKVISHPGLMFEISNPCASEVRFDEQGLPIPSKSGHGVGRHSIVSFCRKHDASCQFSFRDGLFSLRVIL